MPSNGAFTDQDIDKPQQKGKFTDNDIDESDNLTQQTNAAAASGGAPNPGTAKVPLVKPTKLGIADTFPELTAGPEGESEGGVEASKNKPLMKGVAAGVGGLIAPELLPEIGGVGGLLARGLMSGAGAGVGTSAGQAVTGENPLSKSSLKESGTTALEQSAIATPFEALGAVPGLKLGRSMINESMGATARDVTYGNPAKALLDNEIAVPHTGDIEQYKDALRAGHSVQDAMQAAGGRMAAVSGKINELSPQLDAILSRSNARLPVRDVIDKPLLDSMNDIILHRAMTQAEKDVAINQLGEFQSSLKDGLGTHISPKDAVEIKRMIGDRINWGGTVSVTDEVKPAYKSVYSSLKNAAHQAVPESKDIDENLTNLLAAQSDLHNLSKAEEVGRGRGLTGGTFGPSFMGRAESAIGRVLPGVSKYSPPIGRVIRPALQNQVQK